MAAAAAILAHVVETAQFAAFVGGVVATDITVPARTAGDHGLVGLALAEHRHQGQCRRGAVLQPHRLAQGLDFGLWQFLGVPAQQRLR